MNWREKLDIVDQASRKRLLLKKKQSANNNNIAANQSENDSSDNKNIQTTLNLRFITSYAYLI